MILNILLAAWVIRSIYILWVKDISVFFNRYDMPVMALSGVLISWDILAMKLDLNSFASSASRFAFSKSSWICFLCWISFRSRAIQKKETDNTMRLKQQLIKYEQWTNQSVFNSIHLLLIAVFISYGIQTLLKMHKLRPVFFNKNTGLLFSASRNESQVP